MAELTDREAASQKNISKAIGPLQKRTKENIATPDQDIFISNRSLNVSIKAILEAGRETG